MDFYEYYLKKYNDADSAEEFDIDPENMERMLLELYIQHQAEDGLDEDADEHRADALKRLSMYEERFRLLQKLDDDMIRRQENAIRTDEDFYEYVRLLDRRDANAERRARYHEIGRGEVPLEFGMDERYSAKFPRETYYQYCTRTGRFLDIIYDCPNEISEYVADPVISTALKRLKPEHKEILHFRTIRNYSTEEVAKYRGQTDRNIRSVYNTAIRKVNKEMEKLRESERKYGKAF